MNKFERVINSIWCDVVLFIAALFVVILLSSCSESPHQDQIFHTSFGDTLCAKYRFSECGVTLSNCADGYIYGCLTNVRFEQK